MKESLTDKIKDVGGKIRVFISSVQKELEPERLAVVNLMSTD